MQRLLTVYFDEDDEDYKVINDLTLIPWTLTNLVPILTGKQSIQFVS